MNKFSINDWLTIQTRKDLLILRRSLKHAPIQIGILLDLLLVILASCLDHIYTGGNKAPSGAWITIIISAIVITVGVVVFGVWKEKRKKTDHLMVMSVGELVDLFDNEVCYNIMTADSMKDHLELSKGERSSDSEVQKFYFIEACYYLDKTITQLYKFEKNAVKVICRKEDESGVSFVRFQNVCNLIQNNYMKLIDISCENKELKPLINGSSIKKFNDLVKNLTKAGYKELAACEIKR